MYVGVCRSIIPIPISAANISHLKHTSHTPVRVMRHSSDRQMAVATSGGGRAQ